MNTILFSLYQNPWFLTVVLIWSIFWKGKALWTAAGKKQLTWFIILLLINTIGLLEILYLLFFQRFDLGSKRLLNLLNKRFSKKQKS